MVIRGRAIRWTFGLLIVVTSGSSTQSWAADACQYFLSLPINCKSAVSGGAYPSFADSFNVNPASIPTFLTPVGVETFISSSGPMAPKPQYNFAIIKGFDRFGTAFSSNNDRTFYTFNLFQSFYGSVQQMTNLNQLIENSVAPSLNLGSALALPLQPLEKYFKTTIGGGLRLNRLTQQWDLGYGGAISGSFFNLGISSIKKRASELIAEESLVAYNIGLKLSSLQLEYTLLSYSSDYERLGPPYSLIYRQPVKIVTGTVRVSDKLLLTGAYRTFLNILSETTRQVLFSSQLYLRKNMTLGYSYNYIPGSHSLNMQYFFF